MKYSFERYTDEDLAAPNMSGDWAPLKDVEVVDKYSGISMSRSHLFGGVHCLTQVVQLSIKLLPEALGENLQLNLVQLHRPYKIERWDQGQQTVLVAHDGWNGKKPAYDRVVLIPINDAKSTEVAFEAGQIDVSTVAVSSVPELQSNMPANSILEVRPTAGYFWLGN